MSSSSFKWSSPVRKSDDDRILSPLPRDVYLEIFSHIKNLPPVGLSNNPVVKRELRNLALVCRFFCATVTPWILEHICFDRIHPDKAIYSFCRSVVDGDQSARPLAKYVTKCEFFSWVHNDLEDEEERWISDDFLKIYAKALAYMPNVEELGIYDTVIGKRMLKSISKLRSLSTLKLSNCRFIDTKYAKKLSELKLKSFDLGLVEPGEFLESLGTTTLSHLTVHYANVGAPILQSQGFQYLERLELDSLSDIRQRLDILTRTPSLKFLRLGFSRYSGVSETINSLINQDVLPLLEGIDAPVDFLRALIPGRPVSSFAISHPPRARNNPLTKDDFLLFGKSTQKITSIRLPLSAYVCVPLTEYFPDLRTLKVDNFSIFRESKDDICMTDRYFFSTWPRHPAVKTLQLDQLFGIGSASLGDQRHWILTSVVPHFPKLQHLAFNIYAGVYWSCSEDGTWTPIHYLPRDIGLTDTGNTKLDFDFYIPAFKKCHHERDQEVTQYLNALDNDINAADINSILERRRRRKVVWPDYDAGRPVI